MKDPQDPKKKKASKPKEPASPAKKTNGGLKNYAGLITKIKVIDMQADDKELKKIVDTLLSSSVNQLETEENLRLAVTSMIDKVEQDLKERKKYTVEELLKTNVRRLAVSALEDMGTRGCGTPGCNCQDPAKAMVLQVPCHPGAGIRMLYARGHGDMYATCELCGKVAYSIGVALI